jgi:PQQ-dependent dehydrogenase (methanol/ethanol family)
MRGLRIWAGGLLGVAFCAALATAGIGLAQTPPASDPVEAGRARFNVRCAGCHGQDALGGERAPAITLGSKRGLDDEKTLRGIVRHGIPNTGMPAFDLPAAEFGQIIAFVQSRVLPLSKTSVAGDADAGEKLFFGSGGCAQCHLVWGRGGLKGPGLTEAAQTLTLGQVEAALLRPNSLHKQGWQVATVQPPTGPAIRGFIRNESDSDLQLQGLDGRLHLLSKHGLAIAREKGSFMPAWKGTAAQMHDVIAFLKAAPQRQAPKDGPAPAATPDALSWQEVLNPRPGDWPSYNGRLSGNRYTGLAQVTPANVARLAPRWTYPVPGQGGQPLEGTPVVVGGVMYVTRVNSVYALDAATGRTIWQFTRPPSKDLVGDAAGGINRGVAVLGDRLFVVTDNAHLLALHRLNGALLWDVEMADSHKHYGATSAPLVVGDLVISGVSGGDEGIRGQLNAFDAATGRHVWRFWSIPAPGEPNGGQWVGRALEHGCGATWLTGTYDRETGNLIWPIGNPCPDFNGDERKGDNLYTDSVVALDPKTGALKWHYQFTPHDLHDWDATEVPMLVDMNWHGAQRKLLLQGNRNGFFYVLDRTNGKFLAASPFVKKLTWATRIAPDGRPVLGEGWQPTEEGTRICPSMSGASNWMSSAWHPGTGLFYLIAMEKCNIFSKNGEWWKQGESFYGGASRPVPDEEPRKFLRAIDPQTGKIVWEHEQAGHGETWGGVLATASGLLFACDDDGSLTAHDARTGKLLWRFQLNARWHASPMTYSVNGRQFIAVAANDTIVSFGLPQ